MLVASLYYHMYSFATNELPQISFDKTCNSANHKELAQACLNYSLRLEFNRGDGKGGGHGGGGGGGGGGG